MATINIMKKRILLIVIIFGFLTSCVNYQIEVNNIEFNKKTSGKINCEFRFPNSDTNSKLKELRNEYKIDELVKSKKSDLKKAIILLNWTNNRWKHNGQNEPKNNDALTILKEAENGKNFRCVEYGIVLSETLNSIGIPSRVIGLKTKNVETTESGAGHVATEAYISELKKWIFLDPQMNYIPYLNEIPLNAVEYQKAISNNRDKIKLKNLNGELSRRKVKSITKWIYKYLFYFDTSFDQEKGKQCKGKSKLMLVPKNAKEPKIFQQKYKIDNCIYTNNLDDFYKKP